MLVDAGDAATDTAPASESAPDAALADAPTDAADATDAGSDADAHRRGGRGGHHR